MTSKPTEAWAVTVPDWYRGKSVGRRALQDTCAYQRKGAVAKFKAYWTAEKADAKWREYRTKHGYRVERVQITVMEGE